MIQVTTSNMPAKGQKLSIESRTKISEANKNKSSSPLWVNWLKAQNARKGIKLSKEHRQKLSLAHTGNTGDKSGNWRGGVTSLNHLIRGCLKSDSWRVSIFERDDFTCQMPGCNIRGGYLEANHIVLFSRIIKSNNIKCLEDALRCQELWNINNGITLCQECHRSVRGKERIYEPLFILIIKLKRYAKKK